MRHARPNRIVPISGFAALLRNHWIAGTELEREKLPVLVASDSV